MRRFRSNVLLIVGICLVLGLWGGHSVLQRELVKGQTAAGESVVPSAESRGRTAPAAAVPPGPAPGVSSAPAVGTDADHLTSDGAPAEPALMDLGLEVVGPVPEGHLVGFVSVVSDPFEQMMARLERASSLEEAMQALRAQPSVGPAANVQVTVRNDSGTWKATTDSRGRFELPFLPTDTYEVTAEAAGTDAASSAMAVQRIQVDGTRGVSLLIRPDTIAVKGRICSHAGLPIAGARILGEKVAASDQQHEISRSSEGISAVSDENGWFELRGFVPPHVLSAAAYLRGPGLAGKGFGTTATLTVQAEGYEGGKVVVPLITEELLGRTRRFSRAISRFRPDASQLSEQVVSELPTSQGNTIVGMDLALRKAGK
jgi:hypothetical protein